MSSVPVVPPRRVLVTVWLTVVISFGVMLTMVRADRDPGDDPDPARQRPGLLDLDALPIPAPTLNGLDRSGPLVVFFHADDPAVLCHRLTTSPLRDEATIGIVTDDKLDVACPTAAVTLVDDGDLARQFRIRTPVGGGYPTGYAVVDAAGQIRYATLDPTVTDELDEVRTIVRALR